MVGDLNEDSKKWDVDFVQAGTIIKTWSTKNGKGNENGIGVDSRLHRKFSVIIFAVSSVFDQSSFTYHPGT